jgi:hypothetical protein
MTSHVFSPLGALLICVTLTALTAQRYQVRMYSVFYRLTATATVTAANTATATTTTTATTIITLLLLLLLLLLYYYY